VDGDGVPDQIVGAGPGLAPDVRVIDGASGLVRYALVPLEPEFQGGVFVATGDVNGDGFADIIVGAGEGRAPEVKVYRGRDLRVLYDVNAFDPSFLGGVHVASGDVNADGFSDLVFGSGLGAADVRVLSGFSGGGGSAFSADTGCGGGAWVAAGDVTGDGFAEVVTGAGAGGG